MSLSIVVPANNLITVDALNFIISKHRQHQTNPNIVIAYDGTPPSGIDADTVSIILPVFNLSKLRNYASLVCGSEWLVFADGDTYFTRDLTESTTGAHAALRGNRRTDVLAMTDTPATPSYEVVAAPMLVRRDLFIKVGGYHMGYDGYGYEDGDFLAKLPNCALVDTGAVHALDIHRAMDNQWRRGGSANRELFSRRIRSGREAMVRGDVASYGGLAITG